MENSKLPAFPIIWKDREDNEITEIGLSKREIFAMAAMQGILSAEAPDFFQDNQYERYEDGTLGKILKTRAEFIAENSLSIADELLKKLESK